MGFLFAVFQRLVCGVSKSAYRCKQYIESLGHGGYTVATFIVGVCRAVNRQIYVVGGVIVACLYFWWLSVLVEAASP